MQKFLSNQNKLFLILSIIILQVFLFKPTQVLADLPTGNAVKDPSAILRNALPIRQVELQELQHKLEETRLSSQQIGKGVKYLKEGMEVNVIFHNGKVLEVELPISITLKVTETDPGVKGDTASGGTKPAILETGAQVMVPLFISVGEMIKVDTRNDSYLGREN